VIGADAKDRWHWRDGRGESDAEAEFLHDGVGAFPKQEAGFDGPAVLVIANPTLTLVAKQESRAGLLRRLRPTIMARFMFVLRGL
jgi:hypothetical protein